LFEFNSGVLRWSWRVSYYAATGGIGTDQYPPFTLGHAEQYPATLDIAYPAKLSRGLVLVKWWLLAIPHYLIIGLLVTNWWGWTSAGGDRFGLGPVGSGGLFGLLVVITGIILLVTAKYPPALFGVIVGFNRWIYRVIAYAALMTDQYPPFRLDQGGSEPTTPAPVVPAAGPVPAL
jgi:TM2 domain-containing membrane protein YozV